MKAESIGNKKTYQERGSSILEVLIALAVLTLGISAVIMLVFANQTLKLDSETEGEALYKAKDMLENERADSRLDFALVNPILPFEDYPIPLNPFKYVKELAVADLTPCKKEVTSRITWSTEPMRPQTIELKTDLADVLGALIAGGDCDASGATGDWDNPTTFGDVDLAPAGIKGTGVDAIKINGGRYAVLTSVHAAAGSPDIWLIDANPCTTVLGTPCIILNSLNVGPGLNAVDAARNNATGKYYAYVAADDTEKQFKVIELDFSDPSNPTLVLKAELDLFGVDPAGSYPAAVSISYFDGFVFVGTKETAGPEFHVFDVSNPESPVEVAQLELTHNVNAIASDADTVYLASSSDTEEIIVIDVTTPSAPWQAGAFDAINAVNGNPSDEDGTSIYLLGSKIYLGRKHASNVNERDFYILNKSDLSVLGSRRICWFSSPADPTPQCLSSTSAIVGIVASGPFAFLATDDSNAGFQVWNISDPSDISQQSKCSAYNYSEKASGIDFLDNFGFISNKSNQALRVIYDELTACIP